MSSSEAPDAATSEASGADTPKAVLKEIRLDLLRRLEEAKVEDLTEADLVNIRLVLALQLSDSGIEFVDTESKFVNSHRQNNKCVFVRMGHLHDLFQRFSAIGYWNRMFKHKNSPPSQGEQP